MGKRKVFSSIKLHTTSHLPKTVSRAGALWQKCNALDSTVLLEFEEKLILQLDDTANSEARPSQTSDLPW